MAGQGGGRAVPLLARRRARRRAGTGVRAVLRGNGTAGLLRRGPGLLGRVPRQHPGHGRAPDVPRAGRADRRAGRADVLDAAAHQTAAGVLDDRAHRPVPDRHRDLDQLGVAGTEIYLTAHAAVKGTLFLLTGLLLSRYRSVDELDLHGRARDHKSAGCAFVLAALAP